jgi:hypothetical protein
LKLGSKEEIGRIVLTARRVLHQRLESLIAKKIDMLTSNLKEKSKEAAVSSFITTLHCWLLCFKPWREE